MSQNITDDSQAPMEQPTGAELLGKMSEATEVLIAAQENLVKAAADVAKHTTDPNAHGAATLANIAKAMPKPVLEDDGTLTFRDAEGNSLMEPVNIKGDRGAQGEKGNDGEKGEMPDHRWNGTALQIQKPDGTWGEEQDLQGPKGINGQDGAPGQTPEHEWNGPSLKFKNPDGTWGEAQNLQGPKGEDGINGADGAPGPSPAHQWEGTSLQLQNPDGSWGEPQDLKGEKGDPGDAAIATAEQPGVVKPDGVTTKVDEDGLLSALGGNLLLNSEAWILESGTFTAPVTGWHELLLFGGGAGGTVSSNYRSIGAGVSGGIKSALVFLTAGQDVDVVIGAGLPGGIDNADIFQQSITKFDDITTEGNANTGSYTAEDNVFMGAVVYAPWDSSSYQLGVRGSGLGGGIGWGTIVTDQAAANAMCSARGHFGGSGAAAVHMPGNHYAVGDGAPGSVRVRWHDPAKAAGPAPQPALFAARRMGARATSAPATVNLFDPETGQGSVWREEDAPAKLAEGLISEEAWQQIRAARAAEARAVWLASPDTEAERFALLRAARDARLAATDYLMAPDYPLTDNQRTAVTAYRQALRDLPAQEGAPWDGGGEGTPWPEPPSVGKVQPDELEQTEDPEV